LSRIATSPLRTRLSLSRDLLKLSLLKYRHYEGYFASMHQSGNHWLRHILAMVLAEHFHLPEPTHLADMLLVGEPKCPTQYHGVPRLVFSHKICSPLVHNFLTERFVSFPRYVVMVRDLRSMLVSHYERFKDEYRVPFSDFLRGDVSGHRFDCDIWDSIRFLNSWGRVVNRQPGTTFVLRFEDLKADPVAQTRRIWDFLKLPTIDRAIFERAVKASTKDRMHSKEGAAGKKGTVVRRQDHDPLADYGPEDREFFLEVCLRYLNHDFGYDYSKFEPVAQPARIAA
jgi:hypothetical protein